MISRTFTFQTYQKVEESPRRKYSSFFHKKTEVIKDIPSDIYNLVSTQVRRQLRNTKYSDTSSFTSHRNITCFASFSPNILFIFYSNSLRGLN